MDTWYFHACHLLVSPTSAASRTIWDPQLGLIDYIQGENRLLEKRLGGQRIPFTEIDDRRSHSAHGSRESLIGYTRIRGALANLGHEVGRGTIAQHPP
jgi:hypothetical protein